MTQKVIAIIVIALAVIGSVAYGLDRGIYVGSTSHIVQGVIYKRCRYLFITGISESPAHGGALFRGMQLPNEPPRLYCRFFGE